MTIGTIGSVLKRQVGTQTYYFCTVESDKIKGITFVPVLELSTNTYLQEDPDNGYQRPGSRTRMRAFMRYLHENPSSVVPPVLLSGRDWRFIPSSRDESYGELHVPSPAAIMDGQHRIGGYIALFEEHGETRPVDFIVLTNLTTDKEKDEFITVNNTQKGVPRAQTEYLLGTQEAQLAWALNVEEDSPFRGRISRTGVRRRNELFNLNSVARCIKKAFSHGKLADLDEDTRYEYLVRYWTIIADVCTDEWSDIEKLDDPDSAGRRSFQHKLLELTGLIAWSNVAPEILGRSYQEGIGINWDHVGTLVEAAAGIDWRKTGQYEGRTGTAGATVIAEDMQRLLPADVRARPEEVDEEST